MASMIVGGLFNAVAFAGAGYLFQTFNKHGYAGEIKRHDLATEELQKAKEKFFEHEIKRKDKQRELQDEIIKSNYDMEDTSKAFKDLKQELKQLENQQEEEPTIDDFYQPSNEMEKYQIATVTITGTGVGWLLSKFL